MSTVNRPPPPTTNTPINPTKGQLGDRVVSVLKALPQRTGQAINTFLTNANQRLSRTVESIASGAKRIGSDIRDKLQLAGQTLVNLTKTTATTTAPITSINASAGKLTDVDTAQVNQKLKEISITASADKLTDVDTAQVNQKLKEISVTASADKLTDVDTAQVNQKLKEISVTASADKLTDVNTAQVNRKLKEADEALKPLLPSTPASSAEPGKAASIQATPAKQSDAIGLKDGFTRDFVTDLPRAQYFWQSDSEEPTPILNHAAYAQGDESTKLEILELAKKEIKEITVKTGVDEATLLRASHQAHQGIFGILGSVLQESAASPLMLSREIRGINSDDVEDTLPAASKGQLMGGKTSNAFILSSDGAGGIKVVATSTKTNCNFFAVPGFEPFQLEPEKSSTTLKVEFAIPKNGSPLLTKASYDFNLGFVQP